MTKANLIQFCKCRREHVVLLNLDIYKAYELVKWITSSQIFFSIPASSTTSETITMQMTFVNTEIFLQELVNVS